MDELRLCIDFLNSIKNDKDFLYFYFQVYGYEEDDEYQEFSLQHGSFVEVPNFNLRWNEDIKDQKVIIYFEMDVRISKFCIFSC